MVVTMPSPPPEAVRLEECLPAAPGSGPPHLEVHHQRPGPLVRDVVCAPPTQQHSGQPSAQPSPTSSGSTKVASTSPVSNRKLPRLQVVVKKIGSTLATTIGTAQGKSRAKQDKDFLKAYLKKFDTDEVEVLRKVYNELTSRSPGPGIDKETFLQYFPLPGLWGERLFQRFDYKCTGYVDYEEFLVGIAVCCRGTKCERIHVLFQVFDLNGDGILQREELVAMLSNLPNLDRYLATTVHQNDDRPTDQPAGKLPRALSRPSSDQSTREATTLNKDGCESTKRSTDRPNRPCEEKSADDWASFGGVRCPSLSSYGGEAAADIETAEAVLPGLGAVLADGEKASVGSICLDADIFRPGYRAEFGDGDEEDADYLASDETFDDDEIGSDSAEMDDELEIPVEDELIRSGSAAYGGSTGQSADRTARDSSGCFTDSAGRGSPASQWRYSVGSGGAAPERSTAPQRDAIDVEAFVDKILEECEFSDSDTLTFMEFKTWLEKHDGILKMFTDCLHEEAWGLQGNALFRQIGGVRRGRRRPKRFTIMPGTGPTSDDRSQWGMVEVRPDGFYKIRRLFTVPGPIASLSGGDESTRGEEKGGNGRQPPSRMASRLFGSPSSTQERQEGATGAAPRESATIGDAPCLESTDPQCFEIYPKQTRDVLNHELLNLVAENNPGIDMANLGGPNLPTDDILACPSCRSLLVVCPRCQRRFPSLRLKDGVVVVECKGCLEGVPFQFGKCWHCSWYFSEAPQWVDQCEPLHEGALYKIGRHTHKWRSRYFVLVDNLLYYYGRKDDARPRGFVFLEGCFVEPIVFGTKQDGTGSSCDREPIRPAPAQPATTTASLIRLTGTAASATSARRFGFSISHGGGKIPRRDLYASSEAEREAWLQALRTAMNQQAIEQTYQLGPVLGQGKFSVVHHAVVRDTNEDVAVKVIDKSKISGHERELLRSEIAILRLLRHPHVISLREVLDSRKDIYIVMEYVKGGELYDVLEQKRRLPELHVNRIILQLLTTVAYLHKCGIIHRDLKPENILLTDRTINADIKITDFGLSCICGMDETVTQPCGTLAYVAPEVLTLQGYNHRVDVWSVGVIMHLLLRGRLPFPVGRVAGGRSQAVYTNLTFEGPAWDNVCSSAKDLLRKMLQPDPSKRISAQEALQHLWIKNPSAVISEGADTDNCATGPIVATSHSSDGLDDATGNKVSENQQPIGLDVSTPVALLDVSASTFSKPTAMGTSSVSSPPPPVVSHIEGAQIPTTCTVGNEGHLSDKAAR